MFKLKVCTGAGKTTKATFINVDIRTYKVLAAIIHSSSTGIAKTFCRNGRDWSELI